MVLPYRFSAACVMLFAAVLVAGCGTTSMLDNKIDYRSVNRAPSLDVPPDLTTPGYDERYQVKDGAPGSATFSAYDKERAGQPRLAQSGVLPAVDKARIERAGSQRWLVAQGAPEKVWSTVREFWLQTGFTMAIERPDLGIMETDWAENRAKIPAEGIRKLVGTILDFAYSTNERDKYRTRLERGTEPNTTEIYVSHRGMEEVGGSASLTSPGFVWQPRPPDPELEAEMLRRLQLVLGAPASTQVAAAGPVAGVTLVSEKAKLDKAADGSSRLKVDDPFDRSWRRVGLALDRVGFTVVDRDRSNGLYFVRYADPDTGAIRKKEEGWLSKLAFWSKEDPNANLEQYRIVVVDRGATSEVSVQDKNGAVDRTPAADRILSLLLAQLK
jgi:outer membrane protein assembly factor BamC